MYFRHENGSYKRVPQYANAQLGYEGQDAPNIAGGMTIYYTQKDFDTNGDQFIRAFPPVGSLAPWSLRPVHSRCNVLIRTRAFV
jgi:hypothetical protein